MKKETQRVIEGLECLPDDVGRVLRRVVALAERRGEALYLVGGAVRDLLLGADQLDIDLVVEGDALDLAAAAAKELGARAVTHRRFGTAVVQDERFRLDLARARTERYERPGTLPSVQPARLADDLARRDFSINAMALRLSGTLAGELIDPHGGRADLTQRQVRVLHDASFRDDATRVLRALRYAVRLQFRLAPGTKALLTRDLSYLDAISGARLRHEFERIAHEERVGEIVRLASDLGVLVAVHPALRVDAPTLRALEGLPDVASTRRDAALFCLLLAHARRAEAEAAMSRLSLTGRQADAVRGLLVLREEEANLARASLRPSETADLLRDQPLAAIEVVALVTKQALVAERVRRYLSEWRFVRPRLNGSDVEALSVPHGPQVGAALASLRAARLDGQAQTRDDEIRLIRQLQHAAGRPLEARRD